MDGGQSSKVGMYRVVAYGCLLDTYGRGGAVGGWGLIKYVVDKVVDGE